MKPPLPKLLFLSHFVEENPYAYGFNFRDGENIPINPADLKKLDRILENLQPQAERSGRRSGKNGDDLTKKLLRDFKNVHLQIIKPIQDKRRELLKEKQQLRKGLITFNPEKRAKKLLRKSEPSRREKALKLQREIDTSVRDQEAAFEIYDQSKHELSEFERKKPNVRKPNFAERYNLMSFTVLLSESALTTITLQLGSFSLNEAQIFGASTGLILSAASHFTGSKGANKKNVQAIIAGSVGVITQAITGYYRINEVQPEYLATAIVGTAIIAALFVLAILLSFQREPKLTKARLQNQANESQLNYFAQRERTKRLDDEYSELTNLKIQETIAKNTVENERSAMVRKIRDLTEKIDSCASEISDITNYFKAFSDDAKTILQNAFFKGCRQHLPNNPGASKVNLPTLPTILLLISTLTFAACSTQQAESFHIEGLVDCSKSRSAQIQREREPLVDYIISDVMNIDDDILKQRRAIVNMATIADNPRPRVYSAILAKTSSRANAKREINKTIISTFKQETTSACDSAFSCQVKNQTRLYTITARAIKRLSESECKNKHLIIFSDFVNADHNVNFERFAGSPQTIVDSTTTYIEKLLTNESLPNDLSNIQIKMIVQSRPNRRLLADNCALLFSQMFEERNASVEIVANL